MTDDTPNTPPSRDNHTPPQPPAGMPRWVKIALIITAVIVALIVVLILGPGDHGPGRHGLNLFTPGVSLIQGHL